MSADPERAKNQKLPEWDSSAVRILQQISDIARECSWLLTHLGELPELLSLATNADPLDPTPDLSDLREVVRCEIRQNISQCTRRVLLSEEIIRSHTFLQLNHAQRKAIGSLFDQIDKVSERGWTGYEWDGMAAQLDRECEAVINSLRCNDYIWFDTIPRSQRRLIKYYQTRSLEQTD